ncbi:hypothetical protein JW868_04905 [Candidatus Woesearchaeota archaeon]|nr:hypothetical protein [Candidatus Woesearchaeota archaeon]
MTSFVLIALLFPFFGVISLFVLVGGVLFDVDHTLVYASKKRLRSKGISFKKMRHYFMHEHTKKDLKKNIFVFHTIEFLLLLGVLSFLNTLFLMMFLGLLLHLILDWAYEMMFRKAVKNLSVIAWLARAAKLGQKSARKRRT